MDECNVILTQKSFEMVSKKQWKHWKKKKEAQMSSEKLGVIDFGQVISTHSIFHMYHKHTFVQTAAHTGTLLLSEDKSG